MSPPGDYVAMFPRITRPEDLPAPRLERHTRNYPRLLPFLWPRARRYGIAHRRLHDLGDPRHDRPIDLILRQSKHRCPACRRCFLADVSDLPCPSPVTPSGPTNRRATGRRGRPPLSAAGWHLWRDHRVFVPCRRSRTGRGGGKKCRHRHRISRPRPGDLQRLSAIDELYDGPFCVISIVDNRMYQRLPTGAGEEPDEGDVRRFLREFAARLPPMAARCWITTDGSALYPRPCEGLPGVPHQICEFHVLKEITRAILHALPVAEAMASRDPEAAARPAEPVSCERGPCARRMQRRVKDLFANRHLFVRHHLRPSEKETLRRVTRGDPSCERCGDHGRGLPAVRPPLSDGDGAGPAGPLAATSRTIQAVKESPGPALHAQPGESVDVLGRQVAPGDEQRGGAK